MRQYLSFMTDYPEKEKVYAGVSYDLLSLVVLPVVLSFFGLGFRLDMSQQSWADIGFHTLNFLAAVSIFFGYMKDSFLNVQLAPKKTVKTAVIGALLMLAVGCAAFLVSVIFNNVMIAYYVLPLSELDLFQLSNTLVLERPVFGTVCIVIMAPVTVSLLYYAAVFAPICSDRPKLAYVVTAVVLAVPRILNAMSFWDPAEQMLLYLVRLPMHLIACRIYQKTETIWTPILAHIIVNALSCGFFLLYLI